ALGRLREARDLLERALEQGLPGPARRAALAELARLHRRQGDAAAAARAWRRILDEDPQDLVAAEELAKHLEHRLGDPAGALALVERALGRADLTPAWRRSLEHRWRRLRHRQKARSQDFPGALGISPAG
ncbi:MAG TPA: tetratricopeptide repeat protein, partial [Candidatus Nitrosotenuis sp.]|nr:tetratricopeptide repeat protein [Candidatus Nitrosotenuis sp.]